MLIWDDLPVGPEPTGTMIARCVGLMDAHAEYQAARGDPDGKDYHNSGGGERFAALARVVEPGMTVEEVAQERAIGHSRTAPLFRRMVDDPLDPLSRRLFKAMMSCGMVTERLKAQGLWRPDEP